MTDLSAVLPQFPVQLYEHLIPSLEKNGVSTADLIAFNVLEIAKRTQVPLFEVRQLRNHIVETVQADLGTGNAASTLPSSISANGHGHNAPSESLSWKLGEPQWRTISTLDHDLDVTLGGGIPTQHLVEVTGESGAGKTQILLMLLLAVQCPLPLGLGRSAIYVTTEGALATLRLEQIVANHPSLLELPESSRPSLDGIHVVSAKDLEAQDHILQYGLPPAVRNNKAGLVVIDSIAANFRSDQGSSAAKDLSDRHTRLIWLGHILRKLAREEDIAIVVANQVSDRLDHVSAGTNTVNNTVLSSPSSSPSALMQAASSITAKPPSYAMTLDHQQLFFSGWGDNSFQRDTNLKTPALGLSWTNQISCRIALKLRASNALQTSPIGNLAGKIWHDRRKRRFMKLVYAPWASQSGETEFEIKKEGVFAIGGSQSDINA